ncbi:MAG: DM13 domain-containing protein [Acidimicrobiia bacterium]
MTVTEESRPDAAAPIWKRTWFRRTVLIGAVPALVIAWWLGSPLFLDRTVDEAFPVAAPAAEAPAAEAPEAPVTEAPAADEAVAVDAVDAPVAEPAAEVAPANDTAAGPVALLGGSFVGNTPRYDGTGSATVYDVDGSTVLRFEEFEVTNGPDLRVNLVLTDGSMVDLGVLTGNVGNQNYDIPADVDLSQVESVLIYCRAFSVYFAEASLA